MELRNRAQGRWHDILSHIGIDPVFLRNRGGPCPACGGVDRFRWDDKDGNGTFYCGGGGEPLAGDGFGLIKHLHGCDFPTAARMVEQALGGAKSEYIPRRSTPKPKPQTTGKAEAIWEATKPDSFRVWDHEVASHPYAKLKKVGHAAGARRGVASGSLIGKNTDCIIVPSYDLNQRLIGVECIGIPDANGKTPKQSFGKKGVLVLGNDRDPEIPILMLEGWASAVAWVFAMNKGNACGAVFFGKSSGKRIQAELQKHYPKHVVLLGVEQDG